MNHSCFLANIQTVLEAVGDDVTSDLRESAVGVIVKLKELEYTWHNWQIRVKVLHSWKQTTPFAGDTLEFILADETKLNLHHFYLRQSLHRESSSSLFSSTPPSSSSLSSARKKNSARKNNSISPRSSTMNRVICMTFSSGERKYPRRLYDVGKTPIQIRSMNHSCFLANIQTVLETVGDDVTSNGTIVVSWPTFKLKRHLDNEK
ncbi:hypothetical protein F2Q68_00017342 [Brassica cretica]|uniref:Replication protein A 70 kDa DNA-binding subunit B/D first OB fold domain-containing protein n=1 Tax=Brassica cretica TaxID=69181 RepID=A0A8S9HAV3_BRACR|nr:hypothetical protein F2Q68_00017342 [Brassica cretica]